MSRGKQVTCEACGKKCDSKKALKNHCEEEKKRTGKPHYGFKCSKCEMGFPRYGDRDDHEKICKGKRKISNRAQPVICAICDEIFPSKKQLEKHCKREKKEAGESHDGIICSKCGAGFVRHNSRDNHEKKCTGEKKDSSVTCETCSKECTSDKALGKHCREESARTDKKHNGCFCSVCGKGFTQYLYLNVHERDCTGERKVSSRARQVTCEECGKECESVKALEEHCQQEQTETDQIHHGFACECGSKFCDNTKLYNHKNRKCPVTNNSSSSSRHSSRKKRKNNDDRSYHAYLTAVVIYREEAKRRLFSIFEESIQMDTKVNSVMVLSNVLSILDSLKICTEEDFNKDVDEKWVTFERYKALINKELAYVQQGDFALQKALARSVAEFPGIGQITGRFELSSISDQDHDCFLRCLFNDPNREEDSPRVAEARNIITKRTGIKKGDFIGLFDDGIIDLLREHYSNELGTLYMHILTCEGRHIELDPIPIGTGENRTFLHTVIHFTLLIPLAQGDEKTEIEDEQESSGVSVLRSRRSRRKPKRFRSPSPADSANGAQGGSISISSKSHKRRQSRPRTSEREFSRDERMSDRDEVQSSDEKALSKQKAQQPSLSSSSSPHNRRQSRSRTPEPGFGIVEMMGDSNEVQPDDEKALSRQQRKKNRRVSDPFDEKYSGDSSLADDENDFEYSDTNMSDDVLVAAESNRDLEDEQFNEILDSVDFYNDD